MTKDARVCRDLISRPKASYYFNSRPRRAAIKLLRCGITRTDDTERAHVSHSETDRAASARCRS